MITLSKSGYHYANGFQYNTLLSSSISNDYIPFFSLFNCETITIENDSFIVYCLPDITHNSLLKKARFLFALQESMSNNLYISPRTHKQYYVSKGIIYEMNNNNELNILMLLAVESKYGTSLNPSITNLDYTKFVLYLSKDFVNNPEHKGLYKKVSEEYIIELEKLDIDLILTNSIIKRCYKQIVELNKFKTINERKEFMKSLNTMLYET